MLHCWWRWMYFIRLLPSPQFQLSSVRPLILPQQWRAQGHCLYHPIHPKHDSFQHNPTYRQGKFEHLKYDFYSYWLWRVIYQLMRELLSFVRKHFLLALFLELDPLNKQHRYKLL